MLGKRRVARFVGSTETYPDRGVGDYDDRADHPAARLDRVLKDKRERMQLIRRYRGMQTDLKEVVFRKYTRYSVDIGGTWPWIPEWHEELLFSRINVGPGVNQMVGDRIQVLNVSITGHLIMGVSTTQTTPISFRWALVRYAASNDVPLTLSYLRWPDNWSFTQAPGSYILAEDSGYLINHAANNPLLYTIYQPTSVNGYACYTFSGEVIPVNQSFKRSWNALNSPGDICFWFWRDRKAFLGDADADYFADMSFRILYRDL